MHITNYGEIHFARFPYVTITCTGVDATEENVTSFLNELSKLYMSRKSFVVLYDARLAKLPPFFIQKKMANWLKEHKQLNSQYCLGVAFVIPNVVNQLALKTILKLTPQDFPYNIAGSIEEGETFLQRLIPKSDSKLLSELPNHFQNHRQD